MKASGEERALVAVVGPTAVGKTALAIRLAEALDGEVVSADSRLFYRGMDIGTAKPTLAQRGRVPHHLIDIADPDETVGLAEYVRLARRAIGEVHARGKLALLVGGSGQYVRALIEGWSVPRVQPRPELRQELEAQAAEKGAQALHARLAQVDPAAAERIDARNVRRVVRALEVYLVTGQPISEQQRRRPPGYRVVQIGLTMPRAELYARADVRVGLMMAQGLEQEVRALLEKGYGWQLPAMSGLGYGQFRPYCEEEAPLEEVAAEIRRATRALIRQQYNWFRLDDSRIVWFDVTESAAERIELYVAEWLGGKGGAHPSSR
jgi:tRNA dimethylallyltransferase